LKAKRRVSGDCVECFRNPQSGRVAEASNSCASTVDDDVRVDVHEPIRPTDRAKVNRLERTRVAKRRRKLHSTAAIGELERVGERECGAVGTHDVALTPNSVAEEVDANRAAVAGDPCRLLRFECAGTT
jgi:hypothetical protein